MEAKPMRQEAAVLGIDPAQYSAMSQLGLDAAGVEDFAGHREAVARDFELVATCESVEPDTPSQVQEAASEPGQANDLTFDPSDPIQLQGALDRVCVDRGD
jgi:hypothetical protein